MARPSRRHRVMVLVCLRGRSEPMTIVTLGIDLGKNLNSIVGLDVEGRVVLRRRVRRATLAELAGKLPPCTVAMEACCGAHHVGRLRSEEHTSELQSLMRISYAVFCLKKKNPQTELNSTMLILSTT